MTFALHALIFAQEQDPQISSIFSGVMERSIR